MDRFVRYATLTGYPEVARSVGLDPARLMADEGLDIAALATDQDRWIPAVPVTRLAERSVAESGCEDFGVRMAGYRRLSALGPAAWCCAKNPTCAVRWT